MIILCQLQLLACSIVVIVAVLLAFAIHEVIKESVDYDQIPDTQSTCEIPRD